MTRNTYTGSDSIVAGSVVQDNRLSHQWDDHQRTRADAGTRHNGPRPIDPSERGYAPCMEILVIVGIAVLVGAVVLSRKAKGRGSEPGTPEVPGNDGR